MKIKVKDYYALKRGKKRSKVLNELERKEIARKAAAARWNKERKSENESKN